MKDVLLMEAWVLGISALAIPFLIGCVVIVVLIKDAIEQRKWDRQIARLKTKEGGK
jgi:hypothetical protein